MTTARRAVLGDIDKLVSLYQSAVTELAELRGGRALIGLYGRTGDIAASFEAQLADASQLVLVGAGPGGHDVAQHDIDRPDAAHEQIVGYGTCRAVMLGDGDKLGSIEDLFVVPDHRRHGVGRAIADMAVDWCRGTGCIGVDAHALPGSRAVKSFFEGGRFKARLLVMHHKL